MRVVSVPGRRIIDPVSRRVVDDAGILVNPHDPHWSRLIADGDVAVLEEGEPASAEQEAPTRDEPATKSRAGKE